MRLVLTHDTFTVNFLVMCDFLGHNIDLQPVQHWLASFRLHKNCFSHEIAEDRQPGFPKYLPCIASPVNVVQLQSSDVIGQIKLIMNKMNKISE